MTMHHTASSVCYRVSMYCWINRFSFFGCLFCKIADLALLFKNLRSGLNLVVFEAFPLSLCLCYVHFLEHVVQQRMKLVKKKNPMERILRSSSLLSSINNQTLLCCKAHVSS